VIAWLKTMQDTLGEYCDTKRNLSILDGLNHRHENPGLRYETGLLSGYQTRISEEKLAEIKKIITLTLQLF